MTPLVAIPHQHLHTAGLRLRPAHLAAIAVIVPAWVFADYDRRELVARGYEPAPSIGWMLLLPPVGYLLARRRVVGPSY